MSKQTNTKEQIKESIDEEGNEIVDFSDTLTVDEQKKISDSKIRYPLWQPSISGCAIKVYIDNIICMKDKNGIGKHSIMLVCKTMNDKYPQIGIFANTVMLSQIEKFTQTKKYGITFEEIENSIKTLIGKTLIVHYNGEKQPTNKAFKPYKDFTVVEI